MEDIKLVNNINDWNPVGVRTKRRPKKEMERWSNTLFKEAKTE